MKTRGLAADYGCRNCEIAILDRKLQPIYNTKRLLGKAVLSLYSGSDACYTLTLSYHHAKPGDMEVSL